MKNLFDVIKLDANGLVPAIIQDAATGQVLMLGYMNEESLRITLERKLACFWSRSRQELWLKGEIGEHAGRQRDSRGLRRGCALAPLRTRRAHVPHGRDELLLPARGRRRRARARR